jgi:hypothetical protein
MLSARGGEQRFDDAQMYNAESIALDTAPVLSSSHEELAAAGTNASKKATRII